MEFKIGGSVYYNGREGIVKKVSRIDNGTVVPTLIEYSNNHSISGILKEAIPLEGYEVIGVDDLEEAVYDDVIFLDIDYSINSLNQGIFDNYKKTIGKNGVYLKTLNDGSFTYLNEDGSRNVISANHIEHVIILAIPVKSYTMEELYKLVGHKFSIKENGENK